MVQRPPGVRRDGEQLGRCAPHAVNRSLRTLSATVTLLACLVSHAAAAEESIYKRWAVIASEQVRQSGLADLLFAELSRKERIELVERERLDAMVKELELSTLSGSAATGRLKLGQLLQADALLLLSLEEHENQEFARLVISDCLHGARLCTAPLPYEPDRVEEIAERAAAVVRRTQVRFSDGIRWMAAVPRFVSRDLDHRYDHLQVGYASLLEDTLRRVPGVAVVDLEEAHSIRRELEVAGGQLRGRIVPLFVEGEYRTVRTEQPGAKVSLLIRLANGREIVRQFERTNVPLGEVPAYLSGDLSRDILHTASVTLHEPVGPDQQSAALVRRADTFAEVGSWEHATGLREAAILLRPDDDAQRLRVVKEYSRMIARFIWGPTLGSHSPYASRIPMDEQAAMWQAGLAHLEYLICNRCITIEQACDLVRRFLPNHMERVRSGYDLSVEHDNRAASFFRAVMPAGARLPDARPFFHRGNRDRWWGIAVSYAVGRARHRRAARPHKKDFDLLLEIVEEWLPEDIAPTSTLVYWLTDPPLASARAGDDGGFCRAYVEFLHRLEKSKRPINVIYARFGLLLYDYRTTRNVTGGGVAEWDALVRKFNELEAAFESSSGTSVLRGRLDYYQKRLQRQLRGEPLVTWRAAPSRDKGDLGRVRFEPLDLKVLKRDGKQVAFKGHRWRGHGGWGGLNQWTACGPGLDLVWHSGAICTVRTPGLLEELLIDHQKHFDDVKWDGRHAWIATCRAGILILSPAGQVVDRFTEKDGLPPADKGILLHVLSQGRLAAVGSFGPHKRAWCAILTYTNGKRNVNVFHRAVKVPMDASRLRPDPETVFEPSWMHVFQPQAEDEPARLLIGHGWHYPLTVNLDNLEVRGYSLSRPEDNFPGMGAHSASYFSRNGRLLVATDQHRAMVYEPVEDSTIFRPVRGRPYRGGNCRGSLLPYDGWVYCANYGWSRFDPETFEEERLGPDRMPVGYCNLRVALSSHYGMIAWGHGREVYRVHILED